MAQTEQSAAAAGASSGGLSNFSKRIPLFITKLYELASDPQVDNLISWNEDGSSIIIWDLENFAKELLPRHFKHNIVASFIRQLHNYGFKKVSRSRHEYGNNYFKRGREELLGDLCRKVSQTRVINPSITKAMLSTTLPPMTNMVQCSCDEQVSSFNSSPTPNIMSLQPMMDLTAVMKTVEENDRLREENFNLLMEVNELRKLTNDIYGMLNNYAAEGHKRKHRDVSNE